MPPRVAASMPPTGRFPSSTAHFPITRAWEVKEGKEVLVLSYNITFYLTLLLCGTNMYIMARYYTGKPLAAFVAALIYAFAPYRLAQIDHIHILAGEWMPLAFLYLDLSLQQGRWRHWILFALFYLLQLQAEPGSVKDTPVGRALCRARLRIRVPVLLPRFWFPSPDVFKAAF